MSPALSLAKLINTISEKIGITASVGLSANKFLAKIASDLEKPRGFSVLGQGEARAFLAARPAGFIWGVGKATQEQLAKGGITRHHFGIPAAASAFFNAGSVAGGLVFAHWLAPGYLAGVLGSLGGGVVLSLWETKHAECGRRLEPR